MFGPQRGSWVGNQREIRQVSPREGLGVVIPIRPGHTPEVLKLLGDGAERGRFYTYFFPAGELIELSNLDGPALEGPDLVLDPQPQDHVAIQSGGKM